MSPVLPCGGVGWAYMPPPLCPHCGSTRVEALPQLPQPLDGPLAYGCGACQEVWTGEWLPVLSSYGVVWTARQTSAGWELLANGKRATEQVYESYAACRAAGFGVGYRG